MKNRSTGKPIKSRTRLNKHQIELSQTKGRIVETVEIVADKDFHSVCIRFRDNTDLVVLIEPALAFSTTLYDWKSGEQRMLRRWPAVKTNA